MLRNISTRDHPAEQGERDRGEHENPRQHQAHVGCGVIQYDTGDHRTE